MIEAASASATGAVVGLALSFIAALLIRHYENRRTSPNSENPLDRYRGGHG